MSNFTRINSKTWITQKSTEKLNDYRRKLNSDSILGVTAKPNEKRPIARVKDRGKDYKRFLRVVFQDRKIISQIEFNKLLIKEFGNSTWYRRRMIELELITSKNRVIKLTQESQNNE